MDEVTVERLIQKYKDNGELDDEDPALLTLKQWPASKQYIDNPEKLPGFEQKVYINRDWIKCQLLTVCMKCYCWGTK